MKSFYTIILSKLFFSLLLSLGVIYLSLSHFNWMSFWGFLNIPASDPFSDFKALNIFLEYKNNGFDPYFKNPISDPIHSVLIYPSIWLDIFDYLNLEKDLNFKIATFLILFVYFFVLIDLFLRIESKSTKFLFIIFFFSTSNFLLIERLNIEIILFCLIYFSIINKGFLKRFFFYTLALILKIFPIFSIFIFIEKKKNFCIVLFFSIIYIFILRDEISLIKNNIIEYALIFAYGTLSISKAIYFYSTKLNLFINNENYFFFKNLLIVGVGFLSVIVIFLGFRLNKKKISSVITFNEIMLLSGGGIYIGTFIFSANIDYRLVFLILTIPYIFKEGSKNLVLFYSICLIACFNSLVFEGGNSYSTIYFIIGSLIYLMKFFILFFNCYFFGKICGKFVNINIKFFGKT